MKFNLIKKLRKKATVKRIPPNLIEESLYKTLKDLNEELPYSIEVSRALFSTKKNSEIPIKKIQKMSKDVSDNGSKLHDPERESNKIRKLIHNSPYSSYSGSMYDAMFKIVLFGDIFEGRKELSQKFLTHLFDSNLKMTIGVDFEVKSLVVDQNRVKLQIWNYEAEDRFRFLLPACVRGSRGGLFLYNVNDKSSLYRISDWFSLIKKELKEPDEFPILVVGIITDIRDEDVHKIPAKEAINIAKQKGADGYIECSVKTGENIEKVFEALTRLMLQQF